MSDTLMPTPLFQSMSECYADSLSPADKAKLSAACHAVSYVKDGMTLGLGSGSTASWMIRCLGHLVREEGLNVVGVPSSARTEFVARDEGVTLRKFEEVEWLDLTIDGADELDGRFNLIKGGGGSLLREKIIAAASDQMIVIADASKDVAQLGVFALPVEVIQFGWNVTKTLIEETVEVLDVLGSGVKRRMNGAAPFVTDEGNYILDLDLQRIRNPRQLALIINQIPGVVENGLFVDICDVVIIGQSDGRVETRELNALSKDAGRGDVDNSANIFADL
jgi:ribose 5-phosphate isomerase A